MSVSVRGDRVQAPDKTLALPLVGEARRTQPTYNADAAQWVLTLIGRAIDRTMARKEAAYLMGIDQGNLTRQLYADGHLSALRLGALPEQFWLALADELRGHFGMLDRTQLIEQGEALIDRGRQLLAKAAQR